MRILKRIALWAEHPQTKAGRCLRKAGFGKPNVAESPCLFSDTIWGYLYPPGEKCIEIPDKVGIAESEVICLAKHLDAKTVRRLAQWLDAWHTNYYWLFDRLATGWEKESERLK